MKWTLKFVCDTLIILGFCLTIQAAEAPKLAILPTNPDFAALADALTVGLSAKEGLVLVEREQIQKVWKEQELAAGQRRDFVQLGRTLNADGLLLLERRVEGTNEVLSARLVAVKPGVVLAEHRFVLPLAQPVEWGKSYAAQIENLLPKLAVKREEAVGISILNLRSSVSTPEGLALEQELTTLLRFRLTHEPAIFVLERQRMEELQTEKDLDAKDPEPFWNGAYVLDGTINRDVVSRETVSINARLSPARGTAINLEASGRSDALSMVVDHLAGKLLASIGKSSTNAAWRPALEAERFREEAAWASRWGLLRQEIEAADASWALGQHTRVVAAYRVASRASLGASMKGPLDYEYVGPYGFRPPPSQEMLTVFAGALEVYRGSFQEFAGETNGPGAAWGSVGLDLLVATARVLVRYQEQIEFRQGHEEDLHRVRGLAREINGLLTTNASLGPRGWPQSWRRDASALPSVRVLAKHGPITSLWDAWLESGGLWFEKPADAVMMYERLLAPSVYPVVRGKLLSVPPPLAAWSFADRTELSKVWIRFAQKMTASTNTQMRLDGLRLILATSQDPEDLKVAAHRFTDEAWAARQQLARGIDLEAPVVSVLSNLVRRVETWGSPPTDEFKTLSEDWSRRFQEAGPDLSYLEWVDFLSRATNSQTRMLGINRPSIPPRTQQVQDLIAQFDAIEREHRSRFNLTVFKEQVRSYATASNEGFKPAQQEPIPAKAPLESKAGTLRISHSWSLKTLQPQQDRDFGGIGFARNVTWHEEHLWLETRTFLAGRTTSFARPSLVSLDPQTMRAELFESPFEDATHPWVPRRSLVLGKELFICAEGALWQCNTQQQWHRLPISISGWTVPYAWGNRIVLSGDDSILEVEPQTAQVRILASNRRTPPLTALDAVQNLRQPALAVWPQNKLCALVNRTVWTYDPVRQDWLASLAATNCGETLDLQPTGIFFRQSGQCGPRLLGGRRAGSSLLESYTWEPVAAGNRGMQVSAFTPPLWMHPEGSRPHASQTAFDGANVWVFPMPIGEGTYSAAEAKPPPNLLFFDRKFLRPIELRLELTGSAQEAVKALDDARKGWGFNLEFLPTPMGLAILICQQGILLWVPKADLDTALAEAQRRALQPERMDFAAIRRFDKSQKGWLEDEERRAMRHDAGWAKEQEKGLNGVMKTEITLHAAQWEAVFASADKDRDGKISSFELAEAVKAHPENFASRLRGVNTALAQAMRPYDLNNDGAFDRAEFFAFLADPRLVAEVNVSVDWVTKFGLKPELCDTNDDGILDKNERLQVNRMIRERLAGTAVKR